MKTSQNGSTSDTQSGKRKKRRKYRPKRKNKYQQDEEVTTNGYFMEIEVGAKCPKIRRRRHSQCKGSAALKFGCQ